MLLILGADCIFRYGQLGVGNTTEEGKDSMTVAAHMHISLQENSVQYEL